MHVHLVSFYTVVLLSSIQNPQQTFAQAILVVNVEGGEEEETNKKDEKEDDTISSNPRQHGLHHNLHALEGRRRRRANNHIRNPKYSKIAKGRGKEEQDEDTPSSSSSALQSLDSISLVDRWHWILSRSTVSVPGYDDDYGNSKYQNTPFAQLLLDQQEQQQQHRSTLGHYKLDHHHHTHHHHHTKGSGSHRKHKKMAEEGPTLYSMSWSILLTTLTILAMTCATSLSSLVYRNLPTNQSSNPWEHISQVIPIILSSEYEALKKIKRFIRKKCLTKSLETVEKMILMELWRTFWMNTFRLARTYFHYIFGESYYDSIWECYAPGWLRRGVRSVFVKKVQGRLQSMLYGWITKGWEVVSIGFGYGWLDYEIIQEGQIVASPSEENGESYGSGGSGSGETVDDLSLSDVHVGEIQGHHELIDDIDMDLEMEFEDGSMGSVEQQQQEEDDFVQNDDFEDDFSNTLEEESALNDDDFINDDSVACPDDGEC